MRALKLSPLHLHQSVSGFAAQWHSPGCTLPFQAMQVSMVWKYAPGNLISNPTSTLGKCRWRRLMPHSDRTEFFNQQIDGAMASACCQWELSGSTNEAANDEFESRSSGNEVREEILKCYKLVEKLGRGAVYLGSARFKPDHSHFSQTIELAREVALLLNCTSWTGVGPGLMDAASKGALQAGKPVGGFKINNEGGKWMDSFHHPYLIDGTYLTCRFFSARKHGLVDAGVRSSFSDQTAFIALPGGIGTLDEVFEVLTLFQLDRIGSDYPVPFILMNYDNYYDHLLRFLQTCEGRGTVSHGEIDSIWRVCKSNFEALEYLADFYGITKSERTFRKKLQMT